MAQRYSVSNNNSEMVYHDSLRSNGNKPEKSRILKQKNTRDSSAGKGTGTISASTRSAVSRDPRDTLTSSKGDTIFAKTLHLDIGSSQDTNIPKVKNNFPSDSWRSILRAQASLDNVANFNKFDPLRTIHFLSKELQSQLKNSLPHDSHVFGVLNEMQNAIKRVPRDIQSIADIALKKQEAKLLAGSANKHTAPLIHQGCQTPNMWYLEPVILQQHLEESSEKIEKACHQMEMLCAKLKSEKENLEAQLKVEKDNASFLIKQIDDYKNKQISTNALIESLKCKNNELSMEIQKYKIEIESQRGPAAKEMRSFIHDLQKQHADLISENDQIKKDLRVAQLDSEKYEAILEARDMQVKEIRFEMTQLQEAVNEHLYEFQNITSSEDVTRTSDNITDDQNWKEQEKAIATSNKNDRSQQALRTNQPMQELFTVNLDQYDGAQSADSIRASALTRVSELDLGTNILNKRHVYKVPVDYVKPMSMREELLDLKSYSLSHPQHANVI